MEQEGRERGWNKRRERGWNEMREKGKKQRDRGK